MAGGRLPLGPRRYPFARQQGNHRRVGVDTQSRSHGSMIRSARSNSEGGIVRFMARAVLALIVIWKLEGREIASSCGLAPLRILSTYPAACRKSSVALGA